MLCWASVLHLRKQVLYHSSAYATFPASATFQFAHNLQSFRYFDKKKDAGTRTEVLSAAVAISGDLSISSRDLTI